MQISFTYDGVKYVITEEGLLSQCLRQKILDKGESLNEMPPDVATVQNCMAWLLEYARQWVQCRIRRIMHYYSNNEEDD